jgi:hypothetical protein
MVSKTLEQKINYEYEKKNLVQDSLGNFQVLYQNTQSIAYNIA